MIKEAKIKCPNMDIKVANSNQIPFEDNKFDIITASMAYHHFDDQIGFAREVNRVLKNEGYLYIVDPKFPKILRQLMNFVLKKIGIIGKFETPEEVYDIFKNFDFKLVDFKNDGYAQLIKMQIIK